MNDTAKKYLVDTLLFVNICSVAIVGVLLGFVIPRGPGVPPEDKIFLGLHRHQWGDIHLFLSVLLLALVVLHLLLSWKWVKTISKRLFAHRWKKMLAATSLAWIVVLFVAWLAASLGS